MLQDQRVSVAALYAAEENLAVACGSDRRASRRGIVHSAMRADRVENRMAATRIEIRADAREVQWSADESLSHAAPFRRVVAGPARLVAETRGAKRLALIHEFRCDDVAVAQFDSVAPELFVDDVEGIAVTDILDEVDVVFEDAGHVHR